MSEFKVHILGCGSALPVTAHLPSSQVIQVGVRLYMIDCGEGAQQAFRRQRLNFSRLRAIFISHLHGDHCFGLPGLLSSLGMLGRTNPLEIYGPMGLKQFICPILEQFCQGMAYEVVLHEIDSTQHKVIFEDKAIRVWSLPLEHRTPTSGFLIAEQPKLRNINKEVVDRYAIPLSAYRAIKEGHSFATEDGLELTNQELTLPSAQPRRYAYCSDTSFLESLIPLVADIDLLYHEATFEEQHLERALATGHSTASQAATIAQRAGVRRLMIGHYSARYPTTETLLAEAQSVFPDTIAADEGLCVEVEPVLL